MSNVISKNTMSDVLSKAFKSDLLDGNDTSVIFYDLTFLENRITELKNFFHGQTLHAIAIKANPLPAILRKLQLLNVGVESASIGEIYIALKCNFSPDKIVFDSPAKSKSDLLFTLEKGIRINADSFQELERIYEIKQNLYSESTIGLRINPQTGDGSIAITSVAGKYSKFGAPLLEAEAEIINSFKQYKWLSGLHLHVGSQGISIDQLVESCKKIIILAEKIGDQIKWIDIGGGLPVNYSGANIPSLISEYAEKLNKSCPKLFDGSYQLLTEFGRHIFANAGWVATQVEYVKSYSQKTAILNVGADLFLRESYQPDTWKHIFSVVDNKGLLKNTPPEKITLAGPLCFSGDVLAKDIILPAIQEGDYLLIHDSGAYSLSMWSRYNSRLIPKVIGYRNDGESFEIFKAKESLEDLYNFWS